MKARQKAHILVVVTKWMTWRLKLSIGPLRDSLKGDLSPSAVRGRRRLQWNRANESDDESDEWKYMAEASVMTRAPRRGRYKAPGWQAHN